MSVQSYSNRFITNFSSNINSIISNVLLFAEARDNLNDNDWKEFYKRLKISYRIVQIITRIGRNKIITNKKYIEKLPASIFSLYELQKIKDEKLLKLIEENKVNSNTTRFDIQKLNGLEVDSPIKKEGTNRFVNVRFSKKNFQIKYLKEFNNDLKNLVKKYSDKISLEIEDFKIEERFEKEKQFLLRRLKHQLDMEKNSNGKDYKKIYDTFKKLFENLGKDTLDESKKILNSYS